MTATQWMRIIVGGEKNRGRSPPALDMRSSKERVTKSPPVFYGWVIAGIALLAVIIIYGLRYSFSVFYVVILDEFGWSRAGTAIIFSLYDPRQAEAASSMVATGAPSAWSTARRAFAEACLR